jgi:DNA-directed RNA polymerase II subunit RPB2
MTSNQLIATLSQKLGAISGNATIDATPFQDANPDTIGELLAKEGYHKHGWEQLYNGATGMPISALIFIGPTYYQRLKHMVADKHHARKQGRVQTLTKQPTEGKKAGGGLRFGEMERDAIIAHGASGFLREKLFLVSDKYSMPVCSSCGLIGAPGKTQCQGCYERLVSVEIPYASKLLIQELLAMNIALRIKTS